MTKHFSILAAIFALIFLTPSSAFAQDDASIYVGKINRPSKPKISNGDLIAFTKANHLVPQRLHLQQVQLTKVNQTDWYLVAYSSNEEEIFAYPLERRGRKLFLLPKTILHICSCESDQTPDTVFVTDEEGIKGCTGGDHTISISQ